MSDAAAVGIMGVMLFAIVYVIYSIGCARKADAMMRAYEGFFTKMEAYLYVNAITVAVVCIVLIAAVLMGVFTFVSPVVDVLLYIALAAICILYVMSKRKKLIAKYGESAARDIIKAMSIVGNGRAFRSAVRIFGFVAFESLKHEYVRAENGTVRVVQSGEHSYVDADGNVYTDKDIF